MSASVVAFVAALIVLGLALFLAQDSRTSRLHAEGLYGGAIGAALGVRTVPGDPRGAAARIPAPGGLVRSVRSSGTYGGWARMALAEEQWADSSSVVVCHLWIDAGLDADVVRGADGSVERTHGSRRGLADRTVAAIGDHVPDASLVWSSAGCAPTPVRDQFDRSSAPLRPIGLPGHGPTGAIGLALPAEAVTNPVAWFRWLRDVVLAVEDDVPVPSPPGIGFG